MKRQLALLLLIALASCETVRTTRIIDVREPPPGAALRWSPEEPGPPFMVDTDHFLYCRLLTSIYFESDFEDWVRAAVEQNLGQPVEELEVVSVGWRRVWRFMEPPNDFALVVRIEAPELGLSGEYEAVVRGEEFKHAKPPFGASWWASIPTTGPEQGRGKMEQREASLESLADRRAWIVRTCARLATARLVRSLR